MRKPIPLKQGDKVAIVAPSSPISEHTLGQSVDSIRVLGLEPVVFPSCTMSHGYLSGKDMDRARDINNAFADTHLKGIFCLRGGYGATRILPMLDYEMIRKNPKVFVGYSDITAFHLAFNQICGFTTFHGPMPNTDYSKMDAFSLKSLTNNLFSDKPTGIAENPPNEIIETICPGRAQGRVTGGNLSLLQGTLGSPFEVDTSGKILFIEEVGERPYRLDKALTALALAGKFQDCEGIILGTFAECEEPESQDEQSGSSIASDSLSLAQIFDEVVKPFQKPAILNFRAGHIYPQLTIRMGSMVKLDAASGIVEFK